MLTAARTRTTRGRLLGGLTLRVAAATLGRDLVAGMVGAGTVGATAGNAAALLLLLLLLLLSLAERLLREVDRLRLGDGVLGLQ